MFWTLPFIQKHVDSLTDNYNQVLRERLDKHAPECILTITLHPNAPWFNESLRAMKKQRRQFECRYLSTRLGGHRLKYSDFCRTYAKEINSAKSVCYKSLIANSVEKQLFKVIDGLFLVKPVPGLPARTFVQSLTEEFNNYFVTKMQKLRFDSQNNNLAALTMSVTMDQPPCQSAFSEFATITKASIKDTILTL